MVGSATEKKSTSRSYFSFELVMVLKLATRAKLHVGHLIHG